MLTFIGDVHGKVKEYKKIVDRYNFTIQVGDFGFKSEYDWFDKNIYKQVTGQHFILPGNHDYTPYHGKKPWIMSDGSSFLHNSLYWFCIPGGLSIDKNLRTPGLDWFIDEELSMSRLESLFDLYLQTIPEVVVTHVPPDQLLSEFGYRSIKSRTGQFLSRLFEEYQPRAWIFGHMHESIQIKKNNCMFFGLDELEVLTESEIMMKINN